MIGTEGGQRLLLRETEGVAAVNAGDEITTTISYRADVGTIVASIGDDAIGGATRLSTIAMPAVPNDPGLFTFWERLLQQSHGGIEDFVRPEYPGGRRGNRLPG